MFITSDQYKKLLSFFEVFSEEIERLRKKRKMLLEIYVNKKTKRLHKDTLEKIIKL